MADCVKITVFDTTSAAGAWTAGAAAFTAPLGGKGDSRAMLLVDNQNASVIRVRLKAGDGQKACLGDMNVDIAASSLGVIPLGESMRFKVHSTDTAAHNRVTVNLNNTADTALTSTPLSNIRIALIQG